MAAEKKIPRLGKAASEFNVGIDGIVSLLKTKNIEIENSPNFKLTPEMYDILLKEFSNEKQVKEESRKIDMDYSYNKQKAEETVSAEEVTEEEPAKEILIKQVNVIEKEPVQNIEIDIQKPKVVGKIDLDKINPAPKKTKEEPAKGASKAKSKKKK